MRPLLVADLFCGAGGSSTAVRRTLDARGIPWRLVAVNHWRTAIETHTLNHPRAKHFNRNVFKLSPKKAVPGGELDLLMASPTCTSHSRARGGAPISWDQRYGRMTPSQIVRWCKELAVKTLLVENVPEFVDWGPLHKVEKRCDRRRCEAVLRCRRVHGKMRESCERPECRCCTWKGNPKKKGKHFRAWLRRLGRLGFSFEWRIVNAADYGDATTRKRFFLLGRSDGLPIAWPRETHSPDGQADILGPKKKWRAAREIIEWERRGRSIFRREHPLAKKTLERIDAGAARFSWPSIFREALRLHMAGESVQHLLCRCEASSEGAQPFVFQVNQGEGRSRNVRGVDEEPLQTVVTRPSFGLAAPFLGVLRQNADGRSLDEPVPAICAGGTHLGLVEPLVMRADCQGGNGKNVRGADEPAYTPTTNGGLALVVPKNSGPWNKARSVEDPLPVATAEGAPYLAEPVSGEPFVLSRHGENGSRNARARSVEKPIPTATGSGAGYLIEPFQMANRNENAPRSLDEPTPPFTTSGGGGVGLVEPFVLSQGAGGAARSIEEPVPTIPTEGAHSFIAPYHGASAPRSTSEPLGTQTTRDRFALVAPVTHRDDSNRSRSTEEPLPTVTGAPRGELAFIVGAFGERPGQAPRIHGLDEPMPTLCAKGRIPLARTCTCGGIDILFRMLEPDELAAAMSFHDQGERYAFPKDATKTDITRMIGNAVAVRTAGALAWSLLGSLIGSRRKKGKVTA